jgi:hypothetical protein
MKKKKNEDNFGEKMKNKKKNMWGKLQYFLVWFRVLLINIQNRLKLSNIFF